MKNYYYFNTTNIFALTFWSLPETFIRRSLFSSSSGSCHDRDATWQEIGRTCGSACSSPRPGSRIAVLLFLPRCITIVARTGRGIEQTSSDEGLW